VSSPNRTLGKFLVIAALACSATACSGSQDEAVAAVATGLLTAVGEGDGARACDLLAPATRTELEDTSGTSCERAVLEEDLAAGSGGARVAVFDTSAQAVVGSETLFLSRYDGRWLVIAAACTEVPERPYDCSIGLP
jgi:hypothetical protein